MVSLKRKEIIYLEPSQLIEYKGNSRVHDENQINQIVNSIKEFGFTNPILIDEENEIIAGHGRLYAANELKIEKVPCIRLEGLNRVQKRAYVIADNKLALNASWDMEKLGEELKALEAEHYSLDLTGFSNKELEEIYDLIDGGYVEQRNNDKEIDENIETKNECPSCGYKW